MDHKERLELIERLHKIGQCTDAFLKAFKSKADEWVLADHGKATPWCKNHYWLVAVYNPKLNKDGWAMAKGPAEGMHLTDDDMAILWDLVPIPSYQEDFPPSGK